jgi:seryl-tRNA synthetase
MTVSQVHVPFAPFLPGHVEPDLSRRVHYISPDILGFAVLRHGDEIRGLDLVVNADARAALDRVVAKVQHVVERDIRVLREPPHQVLWMSKCGPRQWADPLAAMRDRELVHFPGPGTAVMGGPLIRLMDYLDRQLQAIALSLPESAEYRYPTLIPIDALEKQRYFESFPHFVMFVARLHNDTDTYEEFIRRCRASGGAVTSDVFDLCDSDRYCLPPTMCYHTFQQFSDRTVEPRVITACGKSFRFESRYESGLDRLWDFTIRETVFLGGASQVDDGRRSFLRAACELMDSLGLSATCELANDPFFGAAAEDAELSQRIMELKYEMVADLAEGRRVAVGSFNLHGDHFGRAFGVALPDGYASSACVGFGLERLVYVFVTQHGIDPAAWPAHVRAEVDA